MLIWQVFFSIFLFCNISWMVAPKPIYIIFWKNSMRCTYLFCQNCDWFFAVISKDGIRWAVFFNSTLELHKIWRQMTRFSISSLSLIRWYIPFLHFKTFRNQFHGVRHLSLVLACKINIYMPKMILSSLLM